MQSRPWSRFTACLLAWWITSSTALSAQDSGAWSEISKYFQPPAELASPLASLRSPLLFRNGERCSNAVQWPRRRAEIESDWTRLMGSWPALLARPELEILSETQRQGLRQFRVRCPLAEHLSTEGWYLLPQGAGPFPAVLVVYYEPETSVGLGKEGLRDFGLQLARRGFATLSIGTPGGSAWKPDLGQARCQPLSFHAYIAANCWNTLARRREIDARRIGVVGHSYGGKWAMFAAALWDRFACVAVSDPGIVFDESRPNVNYWEPWYLGLDPRNPRPARGLPSSTNPRTGAYKTMIEQGRDLHELHALIAPRPFFVSGGSEDPLERWAALNHAREVNHLLGFSNRVAMTSRPAHTPTEASNEQLYRFFEWTLLPNPDRPR